MDWPRPISKRPLYSGNGDCSAIVVERSGFLSPLPPDSRFPEHHRIRNLLAVLTPEISKIIDSKTSSWVLENPLNHKIKKILKFLIIDIPSSDKVDKYHFVDSYFQVWWSVLQKLAFMQCHFPNHQKLDICSKWCSSRSHNRSRHRSRLLDNNTIQYYDTDAS